MHDSGTTNISAIITYMTEATGGKNRDGRAAIATTSPIKNHTVHIVHFMNTFPTKKVMMREELRIYLHEEQ